MRHVTGEKRVRDARRVSLTCAFAAVVRTAGAPAGGTRAGATPKQDLNHRDR